MLVLAHRSHRVDHHPSAARAPVAGRKVHDDDGANEGGEGGVGGEGVDEHGVKHVASGEDKELVEGTGNVLLEGEGGGEVAHDAAVAG